VSPVLLEKYSTVPETIEYKKNYLWECVLYSVKKEGTKQVINAVIVVRPIGDSK